MPWADPIPDGLLAGLKTTAPDETGRAKRTRACCDRAFVPYVGSSAPAINYARAGNRRVAPRTAKAESCCSNGDEAGKHNRYQNCTRSHALPLQNPSKPDFPRTRGCHRARRAARAPRGGQPTAVSRLRPRKSRRQISGPRCRVNHGAIREPCQPYSGDGGTLLLPFSGPVEVRKSIDPDICESGGNAREFVLL